MKRQRDFKALEKHRLKGAKLLARGMTKPEVALQPGVIRQTVAAWERRLSCFNAQAGGGGKDTGDKAPFSAWRRGCETTPPENQ